VSLLAVAGSASAFFSPSSCFLPSMGLRSSAGRSSISNLAMATVRVEDDVNAVGKALCDIVEKSAAKAIAEKGHFAFTIPGGSILKMLSGLNGKSSIDWSKATMAYINHRCVALDDETSTDHKAQPLFLESWEKQGLNVVKLTGSTDAAKEEAAYIAALKAIPGDKLPLDPNGMPMFDLSLIGVGTDGHIGSLYPGTPQVADKSKTVVSVVKPASSSISLSLPVMLASKEIVVASAGKSEKYPLGKAEGMVRALEKEETADSFPASALRDAATWILDKDSAALLKSK